MQSDMSADETMVLSLNDIEVVDHLWGKEKLETLGGRHDQNYSLYLGPVNREG
jgi:hypothetical protein